MRKINVDKRNVFVKETWCFICYLKWPFDEGKKSLKIATIPEDMLELLSQNFRLRKLLKDYLAQLLIFEVTGPENQVSTSKI